MTQSIFDQAGYFMNDDRASGGALQEDDLLGCAHCPRPVKKAKWKNAGGMCVPCGKPLCFACFERTKEFGCEGPYEKKIIEAVNNSYRREQNAKILGV
jgi:hypothetical protein